MPSATLTWSQTGEEDVVWVISEEGFASLDQYRQTLYSFSSNERLPTYATVRDLVFAVFMNGVVAPALDRCPTPTILAAKEQVAQAEAALAATKDAVLAGTPVLIAKPILPTVSVL